jgi:glycosyltransferase involved in cell wall biosynthesis
VPTYNGARTMRRALDSLLAQTFTDFEVLLSDNASTDGTEAVGREYAARDPRVRYLRQPVNLGAVRNFLYVLEHTRGPYYSWLACDDYYDSPTHLERLAARLDAGADLAFPNVNLAELRPDGTAEITQRDVLARFRDAATRLALNRAVAAGPSHPVYGMFRREALLRHLPWLVADAGWSCFNEGRFVHRVFAHERCAFVADEALDVGVHAGNLSRTQRPVALLRAFARFTALVPLIYVDADYGAADKARLLADLGRAHLPYLARLTAGAVPSVAADAWARLRSRRPA